MKQDSVFAKRKAEKARRDRRKGNKQCTDCGSDDLATNLNGTLSVKCVRCRSVGKAQGTSVGSKFSASKITAHQPPRIRLSSEELDAIHAKRVALAGIEIARFVREGVTTIGAIRRRFPEFERQIMSALELLRLAGVVDYDDHRPAPTVVRFAMRKRVAARRAGYNNNAIFSAASTPRPDSESLYSAEYV